METKGSHLTVRKSRLKELDNHQKVLGASLLPQLLSQLLRQVSPQTMLASAQEVLLLQPPLEVMEPPFQLQARLHLLRHLPQVVVSPQVLHPALLPTTPHLPANSPLQLPASQLLLLPSLPTPVRSLKGTCSSSLL